MQRYLQYARGGPVARQGPEQLRGGHAVRILKEGKPHRDRLSRLPLFYEPNENVRLPKAQPSKKIRELHYMTYHLNK